MSKARHPAIKQQNLIYQYKITRAIKTPQIEAFQNLLWDINEPIMIY